VFGDIDGVSRVERVRGPYDLVNTRPDPLRLRSSRGSGSDRRGSVLAVPSLTGRYRTT
jgi:hypothetical protein